MFQANAPERVVHHAGLHRFKNEYRSLTDLPKVWRFTQASRPPDFFEPNPERDAFGSMHPNALRSSIWRDQNARRL